VPFSDRTTGDTKQLAVEAAVCAKMRHFMLHYGGRKVGEDYRVTRRKMDAMQWLLSRFITLEFCRKSACLMSTSETDACLRWVIGK
jgi:hypothetical protein